MTHTRDPGHDDRPRLTPQEDAFVRRVGEVYARGPMTARERVAFQAALDAKLARRRFGLARLAPALAGAAAAAVAAWLVISSASPPTIGVGEPVRIAREQAPARAQTVAAAVPAARAQTVAAAVPAVRVATSAEAILALSAEDELEEETLPDEYVAIASLFLER